MHRKTNVCWLLYSKRRSCNLQSTPIYVRIKWPYFPIWYRFHISLRLIDSQVFQFSSVQFSKHSSLWFFRWFCKSDTIPINRVYKSDFYRFEKSSGNNLTSFPVLSANKILRYFRIHVWRATIAVEGKCQEYTFICLFAGFFLFCSVLSVSLYLSLSPVFPQRDSLKLLSLNEIRESRLAAVILIVETPGVGKR